MSRIETGMGVGVCVYSGNKGSRGEQLLTMGRLSKDTASESYIL